eukprot:gene3804-4154_t
MSCMIYRDAQEYRMIKKLGRGSFGEAYLGFNAKYNYTCVIKIYTSKMAYMKMLREILLLQTVCGGPNIMKLYDVIKESQEGHPALIVEYVDGGSQDVDHIYQTLTPSQVQYYMRELLVALAYTHQMEIIHRDLKFHNALINPTKRYLRLIDFGLSIFHEPDVRNKTIVGTKSFEAPELLLVERSYDYKVDMWSYGVMLATLLLRKFPMFPGGSSDKVLKNIAGVIGGDDLKAYLDHLGRPYNASEDVFTKQPSRVSWKEIAEPGSEIYLTPEAEDLLNRLLRWDPAERLSAREAIYHPYFSVKIPNNLTLS